jgi:hypothetical protein
VACLAATRTPALAAPHCPKGLRACRPALVRGYESMVMARLLLEDPGAADAILTSWETLLPRTLEVRGLEMWSGVV